VDTNRRRPSASDFVARVEKPWQGFLSGRPERRTSYVNATQRQFDAIVDGDEAALAGVRGYHTVAMMAAVLDVPVSAVRHWVRGGLLQPTRRRKAIDWFDYAELVIGRRLARLHRAGFGLREIDARLAVLHPEGALAAARLLDRIVVDGRRLSVRRGDALLGGGGQRQLGFYAPDQPVDDESPVVFVVPGPGSQAATCRGRGGDLVPESPAEAELLALAADLDAAGEIEHATEALRALLQARGPDARVSFMLAELLYRAGDMTASRERYYAAIELDPDHLEARTGLGCVLAELGDHELAEAALDGVLMQQPDYADAHWHLAGILDSVGRWSDATRHLRTFLTLAPDSPWARTAMERLADRG
jgi:tetratricopeptide (TPR) repeat protein